MAFAAFIILTFVFAIVSIALILIILVQRPQGGGLATAFGGAGGGNDTAFGGRTGDALTVATVAGFFVYLAVAIGLNIADSPAIASATAPAEVGDVGTTDAPAEGTGAVAPVPDASVTPATPEPTPAATPEATPANPEATPANPEATPANAGSTPPTTPPTTPPPAGGSN
jgi:preprotein translocase subunit SecG